MIVLPSAEGAKKYHQADLSALRESEYQAFVLRALCESYPGYRCFEFSGTFQRESNRHKPDLAMVAMDMSHWFVVEVELSGHSLNGHVIPQIRTFVFGQPQADCSKGIARALGIEHSRAQTLVHLVPRGVAVVVDEWKSEWHTSLDALTAQLVEVSVYQSGEAETMYGVRGNLLVIEESIGFGTYFATDRCLKFARSARVPIGPVQITEVAGRQSTWIASENESGIWLTCQGRGPQIPDRAYVQIKRTRGGGFTMVLPASVTM